MSSGYKLKGVVHIPSIGYTTFIVMFHGFTGSKIEANRLFVDVAESSAVRVKLF